MKSVLEETLQCYQYRKISVPVVNIFKSLLFFRKILSSLALNIVVYKINCGSHMQIFNLGKSQDGNNLLKAQRASFSLAFLVSL